MRVQAIRNCPNVRKNQIIVNEARGIRFETLDGVSTRGATSKLVLRILGRQGDPAYPL